MIYDTLMALTTGPQKLNLKATGSARKPDSCLEKKKRHGATPKILLLRVTLPGIPPDCECCRRFRCGCRVAFSLVSSVALPVLGRGRGVAEGKQAPDVEAFLSQNQSAVAFCPWWATGSVGYLSQPPTLPRERWHSFRSKSRWRFSSSPLDELTLAPVPKVSEMGRLVGTGVVVHRRGQRKLPIPQTPPATCKISLSRPCVISSHVWISSCACSIGYRLWSKISIPPPAERVVFGSRLPRLRNPVRYFPVSFLTLISKRGFGRRQAGILLVINIVQNPMGNRTSTDL